MSKKSLSSARRINWALIPVEQKLLDDYDRIQKQLKGLPTPPRKGCRTRTSIVELNYFVKDGILHCFDEDGVAHKYQPVDHIEAMKGADAWKEFNTRVARTYHETLGQRYGTLPRNLYWVKWCVPGPLNWANKKTLNTIVDCAQKADVSSAYPFELSKRLPTMVGAQQEPGWVEPDTNFPFSFCSDGRMAFVEEDGTIIDTDLIRNSVFYGSSQQDHEIVRQIANRNHYLVPPETTTLRCKAAEGLEKVMIELYNQRHTNSNLKFVMNAAIGCCHCNELPTFAHIAAVVLARCDNRMINLAECLINSGHPPLLIATDSIAWIGTGKELKVSGTKQLGLLCWEAHNAQMCIAGPKAYQIRVGAKTTTTYAGVLKSYSSTMAFGQIAKERPKRMLIDNTTGELLFVYCDNDLWNII